MFDKIIVMAFFCQIFSSFHANINGSTTLPIFWCKFTLSDYSCDFNNVLLNESHFNFQPAAENISAVKKITFNSSTIPILGESICQSFPNLDELHLRKLKIREINKTALASCKNVRSLYLIGNDLIELGDTIFDFNLKLERLYLNINYIRYLHQKVFINLIQLRVLHLQDNKLTKFDPRLMVSQVNLEQLVLHTNDIMELQERKLLECLPGLKKVAFNNNLLPCDRVDEIMRRFNERGVKVHKDFSIRKRFHPQEELYSELLCLDEITWMAVHYRRSRSNLDWTIDSDSLDEYSCRVYNRDSETSVLESVVS